MWPKREGKGGLEGTTDGSEGDGGSGGVGGKVDEPQIKDEKEVLVDKKKRKKNRWNRKVYIMEVKEMVKKGR